MTRREAILWGLTSGLPDDSTARVLEREFPRPDLSYLLMEVRSRRKVASRGLDPDQPIPVGSLLKPFVAYAHRGPFPTVFCHGCWKPGGHGRLTLPLALAQSCNAYFLELAGALDPAKLSELGLAPPDSSNAEAWVGLGDQWRIRPVTLLNAYSELLIRSPREILEGMNLSAKSGTASAIKCDAYAKTGTAPCRHRIRAAGDGYAIALYPAPSPRWAMLAGLDGAPGAHAAKVCGEMLRRIS